MNTSITVSQSDELNILCHGDVHETVTVDLIRSTFGTLSEPVNGGNLTSECQLQLSSTTEQVSKLSTRVMRVLVLACRKERVILQIIIGT